MRWRYSRPSCPQYSSRRSPRTGCLENRPRRSYLTSQIAFGDKGTGSVKRGRSAGVTYLNSARTNEKPCTLHQVSNSAEKDLAHSKLDVSKQHCPGSKEG